MAVLEVNLPSGYYIQQQTLDAYVQSSNVRNLREARYQEKKVEIYFDYESLNRSWEERMAMTDCARSQPIWLARALVHAEDILQEEKSLMTFEGEQIFGRTKIMEKIQGLRFQKICHHCTVIDSQPMFDGGILISVLGQLKTDDDPAHTFLQVFVLKPMGETFYVEHDIFRLALHHTA
ncbi:hypothetical protein HPB47_006392 [Ixodes persulcatus]|uniref:Uncharacterized protein n=1 Tax=Ixodes persulcatus TaxID=34615 RepID=A0AC60PAM9_IXOPE|nr:hypothetical protein HPB47_006392 [Ixodes persulcatus]